MGVLNALTKAVANYGDDVVRSAANTYGDDIVRAAANQADDIARVAANQADDLISSAYNGIRDYKIKNGPTLFDRGFDHFGTQDFDYAKLMRDNEKAISNAVGDDALAALRDNVSGMLSVGGNNYDDELKRATEYLMGDASNPIAQQSQTYIKPGTKIFRAENSPYGISWTTDRNVALNARNNDNVRILEHILSPDDKYIAPQFTELYNQFTVPQSEVLFNWDSLRP